MIVCISPTLYLFSVNSIIAVLISGVIQRASLSLQVIILLEICLEKKFSFVWVKTKLVSLEFNPVKRDSQVVFNRSLRIMSVLAVL